MPVLPHGIGKLPSSLSRHQETHTRRRIYNRHCRGDSRIALAVPITDSPEIKRTRQHIPARAIRESPLHFFVQRSCLRSRKTAVKSVKASGKPLCYRARGRISSRMTVYRVSSSSRVVSRHREMRKEASMTSGGAFMASRTWLRWPLAQAEPAETQMP